MLVKRRLVVWCLAVIAVASVLLNGLLSFELVRSFGRLHSGRIFPLGYLQDDSQGAAQVTTPVRLAIYGDSRAERWRFDPALPPRLQAAEVVNLSHGGITSSQLVLQLETTPVVQSEWALVQIGINDLHPLGALPERRELIRANLAANLSRTVTLLRSRSRTVILTTIGPPGPTPIARRLSWDSLTVSYVTETNDLIRDLAHQPGVVLLDCNAILRTPDGLLAPEFADSDFFLHWNKNAYTALNAALAKLMQ